ncbi:MAG: hypothetical protein J0H19_03595 [Rhodospirillales bacterium]|mgnify:FL=1|nr:hypothetical protein [Rhodospirillales bacterium]MBN8925685.1 hypothetical protein [Rhodospirillales bacterium]
MLKFVQRFLLILYALALVGGSTISFAANASASEPCAHEHHQDAGAASHQHEHRQPAGCLTCCSMGACVAVPSLPPRTLAGDVRFSAMPVMYWDADVLFSGRSISPEPTPPKRGV